MKWEVADMRDLSAYKDASFDVVVDKAGMDALLVSQGTHTHTAAAWRLLGSRNAVQPCYNTNFLGGVTSGERWRHIQPSRGAAEGHCRSSG